MLLLAGGHAGGHQQSKVCLADGAAAGPWWKAPHAVDGVVAEGLPRTRGRHRLRLLHSQGLHR